MRAADARTRVSLLPTAPSDSERLLYTEPRNQLLSLTQVVGWTGLTVALFLFASNSVWLLPFMVWVVFGVVYCGLSFAANTTFTRFDLAAHDRLVARWRDNLTCSVDVFLPNCGEEIGVLENAFAHVASLEHEHGLTVYCLDDAGRPAVEELATRYGFVYLSRPDKGVFKKAGNLRYAYRRSDGDFIVVFDADFCPRPDFLTELLPYALSDPTTGIVQSPQYFRVRPDKNWLENGAGSVQEFFLPLGDAGSRFPTESDLRRHQRRLSADRARPDRRWGLGRKLRGCPHRVQPHVQGIPHQIRPHHPGHRALSALSPDILQPAASVVQRVDVSVVQSKFWHEPIGLRARLTFLAGMMYFLYTAIAVIVAPLPAVIMVTFFPEKVFWWNYVLLVPALLQTFLFLPLWHTAPYGFSAMRTKIVYAWAHVFAFADRLASRPLSWSPSGGPNGRSSGRLRLVKTLMVGWPLATFGLVVVGSALHMRSVFDLHFWPPLVMSGMYAAAAACVLLPLPQHPYAAVTLPNPVRVVRVG